MKLRRWITLLLLVAMLLPTTTVFAEDGDIFRRNISKTPEHETEKAAIFMMDFYVPAQSSTGELVTVDNYIATVDATTGLTATLYEPRDYAKPLISVFIDNIGEDATIIWEEGMAGIQGGITFGEFDAFTAVSLDDGTSWKTTNLSRSSDLSSFNLKTGEAYPGDVHNVVHQVFGDNIFVAWVSKYCEGGTPLYSLSPDSEDVEASGDLDAALYFDDLQNVYGYDPVYLYDFYGVGGTQGSVDYTEQGYPEIGEKPFSCVWTARGKLLAGDDPSTTDIVETEFVQWTKPERLTSGKRDANLPAVDCAAGAGCIMTWQEDPEGLRPGQGLGPGEGWSGAVAWQQTDIWYSHISQADFDKVFADDTMDTTTEVALADYALASLTNSDLSSLPKPYVPMAIPVRLTDNAMCKGLKSDPYCYVDFDNLDGVTYDTVDDLLLLDGPEADADFCLSTIPWTNPGGTTLDLCVTDDNRVLNGRVASTRVRLNFKPYTLADGSKSAWVVLAAEESKALGMSNLTGDEDTEPIDIGKDVWYYTFDPYKTGADHFMVDQGGMLNQPAQCNHDSGLDDPLCDGLDEGTFYPTQFDERGFEFRLTEIARRFALTTNSVSAAVNSESGLSAMLIYKQGIINQGGPADILLRRVVIPDDFDPTVDNPYAFENMDCAEWVYTDGTNPNYLQGVCLSPAINITGNTIVTCDPDQGDSAACADLFPLNDDGSNNVPDGTFPKVYEWRQCDGASAIDGCEDDNDLDDQVWENPFDVAKGHRGFLDGDIVMMMYAWAPNWNSNTVGNDHYNLYVRRSFDGGLTWTTTPAELGGAGVTYFEYYYDGSIGLPLEHEWTYAAGAFEQGRNVSLLTGNKITILDPRYSPTGGMKLYPTIKTDWLTANGIAFEGLPYDDDAVRARDKFSLVYETGDNTTVAVGEATPLDLYYSRATVYGDVWEIMDYTTDKDDLVLDRWPWLENKTDDLSGEAGMLVNPGGTFTYVVWNQWQEEIGEDGHELVFDSDIWFRRLMYTWDGATIQVNPRSSILYQSTYAIELDDEVTFVGTATEIDRMGTGDPIVGFCWRPSKSPNDACFDTNRQFTKPGWAIVPGNGTPEGAQPGLYSISFQALDNDGNWSAMTSRTLLVTPAGSLYRLHVPTVVR